MPYQDEFVLYCQNFNFEIRRDHQKNFLWASRLWVGRRKEPILGYVPKNDEKKNSGCKGLRCNHMASSEIKAKVKKKRLSSPVITGWNHWNHLFHENNIYTSKFYKKKTLRVNPPWTAGRPRWRSSDSETAPCRPTACLHQRPVTSPLGTQVARGSSCWTWSESSGGWRGWRAVALPREGWSPAPRVVRCLLSQNWPGTGQQRFNRY